MKRILLCGEGHGCSVSMKSLISKKMQFDLSSPDPELIQLANQNGIKLLENMENWIDNPNDIIFSSAYRYKIPKKYWMPQMSSMFTMQPCQNTEGCIL